MAVSELNNSKILAQKIVKPSTLSNNILLKYWNGLITKISFMILQNLKFEKLFKILNIVSTVLMIWFSHGG